MFTKTKIFVRGPIIIIIICSLLLSLVSGEGVGKRLRTNELKSETSAWRRMSLRWVGMISAIDLDKKRA